MEFNWFKLLMCENLHVNFLIFKYTFAKISKIGALLNLNKNSLQEIELNVLALSNSLKHNIYCMCWFVENLWMFIAQLVNNIPQCYTIAGIIYSNLYFSVVNR